MYRKFFIIALACVVSLFMVVNASIAQEPITGEWLWMIAPTEADQGGQASTDVDSLAVASNDAVTEAMVASNGANEGDTVGDYDWTLAELPENGDINEMLVAAGVIENTDMNDVSSYALTTLVSAAAQNDVTLGVSSDDSIKVWLNGEEVHKNAVNRGRGGAGSYQDTVQVNLVAGDNLLLIKVSERGGGWGMFAGIDADVTSGYKAPPPPIVHIQGEYLWMIAPTEANQGGANSTDIDSLAVASDDKVTEEMVAKDGAAEGDSVGDYDWTLAELPENGDINEMLVAAGVTEATDFNDVSSYALITLVSAEAVEGAMMGVSSDDSVKVWLNGEVVHNNPVNRGRGGAGSFQDTFSVNLVKGDNLLLIKVSERGGGWGMFAGINADVETAYRAPEVGTAVEAAGKFVTTWGNLKSKK